MTAFPIAPNLAAALSPDAKGARTKEEAEAAAGGPVAFVAEESPKGFKSPEEAEKAFPDLYGGGAFELYRRGKAWRVAARYWRVLPGAPVGRSAMEAARAPLGRARLPAEAEALLGQPAERTRERLPLTYASRRRLMARWGGLVDEGLAEIVEREGRFALLIDLWRPAQPAARYQLTPAERHELAERMAAPLFSAEPQKPMNIGLFETEAPENPEITLAEEGDGRTGA